MKVLLAAINSKYIHTNISLRYLEKITKGLPVLTERVEFTINEQTDRILEEIIERKPDLVAFSVYIWNFELVRELSVLIKCVDENIKILYGGPEVSYDSKKHLEIMSGDYIIRGEGELAYEDLIGSLFRHTELKSVKGLTFRNGDEIIINPDREKMEMSLVPYPYDEEEDLKGKLSYIEASRGCPYRCSYCLSSSERDLRFLPYEEVVRRVEKLLEMGTSVVKFIDRTFNIHPDAYEIWKYLISLDTAVTFHFEISPDLIREEHIALLKTAPVGRIQFEVGIQSTKQEVLLSINRFIGFSKVLEKLQTLVTLKNIHNHMDLIAGLPYDTKESFKESFNDVYSLKPDMLQLGFLKVIKGTPMERDAKKYGIIYSPYAPYEVLKTRWMDFSDLRSLHHTEEALERYYNSGRFKETLSYVLREEKDPFSFYESLGRFTGEKYPGISFGAKEQFLLLRDFSRKWLDIGQGSPQDVVLNELLKFDWLSGNKKQFVPGFLDRKLPENNEEKRRISKALGVKVHVEIYSINILLYAD
ncbi:MAG TPA: B12-binding domain-containing radical SAM protein, partial [Clostridiaceae bacterium]|nr:B12-binding domain-containing radical SAM protein [Clostridiaceae bacterium]